MNGKRPAFELPAELLDHPPRDPQMHRPTATVVGAMLVLLRVATGVLWLLSVWQRWPGLLSEGWLSFSIDSDTVGDAALDPSDIALPVILGVGALVLLVDLVLAVSIFRGSNLARVIVMSISAISISTAFVDWCASGLEITLSTTLLTTASDVLVLLALSSRDAVAYACRNESRVR